MEYGIFSIWLKISKHQLNKLMVKKFIMLFQFSVKVSLLGLPNPIQVIESM